MPRCNMRNTANSVVSGTHIYHHNQIIAATVVHIAFRLSASGMGISVGSMVRILPGFDCEQRFEVRMHHF